MAESLQLVVLAMTLAGMFGGAVAYLRSKSVRDTVAILQASNAELREQNAELRGRVVHLERRLESMQAVFVEQLTTKIVVGVVEALAEAEEIKHGTKPRKP